MKKTISFAMIHVAVAFSVGYLMTGDVWVGGALALVEPLCNTVAYYFHEMFWAKRGKIAIADSTAESVSQAGSKGLLMG